MPQQSTRHRAPIVEVACNDHRLIVWDFTVDEIAQQCNLSAAATGQKPKMNDDDMKGLVVTPDFNVQKAALLESVVRDIVMLMAHHRPPREQGVAMLAALGDGIGLVDHLIAQRCEKVGLAL
jgi:hypothetical protein